MRADADPRRLLIATRTSRPTWTTPAASIAHAQRRNNSWCKSTQTLNITTTSHATRTSRPTWTTSSASIAHAHCRNKSSCKSTLTLNVPTTPRAIPCPCSTWTISRAFVARSSSEQFLVQVHAHTQHHNHSSCNERCQRGQIFVHFDASAQQFLV